MTTADFFESLGIVDARKQTNDVALRAVRRAQNRRGEAATLLCRVLAGEDSVDDARRDVQAALDWFTEAGDVHGQGLALSELARLDRHSGEPDRALKNLQRSLPLVRAAKDRAAEAHALNILAKIRLDTGRYTEAEAAIRKGLDVCPAAARRVKTQLKYWLGETLRVQGELHAAETAFHEVQSLVALLNDPVGRAFALLGLGRVQVARREFRSAEETLLAAASAYDQLDGRHLEREGKRHAVLALAELALAVEDYETAATRLDEYDDMSGTANASASRSSRSDVRQRFQSVAGLGVAGSVTRPVK